jgi:hypothetical protein
MTYILTGTVTLALHRDLPFIPLHCHFIAFASASQFTPSLTNIIELHNMFYDLHHTFTSPDV